jgi:hypothetical protein
MSLRKACVIKAAITSDTRWPLIFNRTRNPKAASAKPWQGSHPDRRTSESPHKGGADRFFTEIDLPKHASEDQRRPNFRALYFQLADSERQYPMRFLCRKDSFGIWR